jgi:catechol 2,3-dioxygenase-like lactoylglutathione lyase family enzyme
MQASLYHVHINSRDIVFYKELLTFLGWRTINESADHLGATDGKTDLWFIRPETPHCELPYHRKAPGLNHLAFRVARRDEIDRFCREFLKPRGISPLYGEPKEYPEYRPGYYAVFFEDPDRIKLEVVFIPGQEAP